MTLFDLFTANAEWKPDTELTIRYKHLGDIELDHGQALDMVYKYKNFEVVTFYKNSLCLIEKK